MRIERLTNHGAGALSAELVGLLADAVRNGASVGCVRPLVENEAAGYWRRMRAETAAGRRLLWAA